MTTPAPIVSWRPRRGWFVRFASAFGRTAAGVFTALLAAAPAVRLWAKILAPFALTWVLVHFGHLVVDRPWPAKEAHFQLQTLRRVIDWAGLLTCAGMLALVGMRLRLDRGPKGWRVELGREDTPETPDADS